MPYNEMGHPEVIAISAAVNGAFTPELYTYLLSLLPNPEAFAALTSRMEANYAGFLKGDPEKVKAFEADRKALDCELTQIRVLAKAAAIKDPKVPETLGLGPVTEKTAATGPLGIPEGFKVVFDPTGHITALMKKVNGAKGYQVWGCDTEPSIEANWKLVASSPNCKGIVITGLNRGKFNVLKARAMRGNGAGPWSNWVSLDPSF